MLRIISESYQFLCSIRTNLKYNMVANMSVAAQRERAWNWAISQGYLQNENPTYFHNPSPLPNMPRLLSDGLPKPTFGNLECALQCIHSMSIKNAATSVLTLRSIRGFVAVQRRLQNPRYTLIRFIGDFVGVRYRQPEPFF